MHIVKRGKPPLGIGRWSASASENGSPLMGRTDLCFRP